MCVSACPNAARRITGNQMSINDVMKVVLRDMPFYRRSGGGITLGGGEPLAQPAFSTDILTRAHDMGIDTAVETSGYAGTKTLMAIFERADHVMFDVKHTDSQRHLQLTGVSNELILDNLKAALLAHPDVTVRYPLIPGCNASYEDLVALGTHLARLPDPPRVEIVPYHRFGEHKYRLLGRVYTLKGASACDANEAEDACRVLRQFDLPCAPIAL